MSSLPQTAATLDDLYEVEGKAELIGGRIVPIMPTGRRPNLIAGRIYRSLAGHVDILGQGEAYTDNMGFAVPELSSGRQSFSPDVSYCVGPFPRNAMRFVKGAPTFAVEVRSEND
jgi:Uma2 family endonuclease